MRRDDSIFLIENQGNTSDSIKMTKAKTAVILVMIICSCGLILSMTDALPTPDPQPLGEDTKLGNNSRLVITHVVKTIEFEVGVADDVSTEENSTDSNTSDFYETDIQLLNVDLLKEVVDQASRDMEGTMEPSQYPQQIADEQKADEDEQKTDAQVDEQPRS